jgi:predicted TPR repeat methyltransferase
MCHGDSGAGPWAENGHLLRPNPVFVSSGDLVADRRYKWALDYLARGDHAGAADILQQVVELVPRFAPAWFALGLLRESGGDRDGAIAALQAAGEADPDDCQGARLHLARLGAGAMTPAMNATYVRRLFDHYASDFEASLLQRLDYRGPLLLFDAVQSTAQAAGRSPHFAAMLDLGCGTGLAGAAFRPAVDGLVGVDLSSVMIEQAARKAIYDRLETGDLVDFLAAESARRASYDLVVAADVFVYLDDLSAVAKAVRRVLGPAGLFAFTVETHAGEGVLLRDTLRYAHGLAHVRAALAGAALGVSHLAEVATRTEKGEPVPGLLVVAI